MGTGKISFHGRLFSKYSIESNGYCVPIDAVDAQRLRDLNDIIRETLNDRLVLSNPRWHNLTRIEHPKVLDCGPGEGDWGKSLLETYGHCKVTNVDINEDQGHNVIQRQCSGIVKQFEHHQWNMNMPLQLTHSRNSFQPETFDFINSRHLAAGIDAQRWPSFIGDLFSLLKPNGWLQAVEAEYRFLSQGQRPKTSDDEPLQLWQSWYDLVMQQRSKDNRVGSKLRHYMEQTGLEHIETRTVPLRIGNWNSSPSVGAKIQQNVRSAIEALSLYPMTAELPELGQPPMGFEQWEDLIRPAQNELEREDSRLYFFAHCAVGRRPEKTWHTHQF
ncbi:hypothetical protein K470DRAFT_267303 [Piedraia hortae CBS 480.64]|uniref:S-adenosyl-L-methionine-dependent methyltransferase n=1 Tax=Piedraia hortae CBS 480.64 TaxID=1314780 RepID=A0A6A7CBQ9_9PEZI|nr:hypothetical protein K470DRAFT_267303 [Piedraia hortae CBS 480.64]